MKKYCLSLLLLMCSSCVTTKSVADERAETIEYLDQALEDAKAEDFLLSVMSLWASDKDFYVTRVDIFKIAEDSDGNLAWFCNLTIIDKKTFKSDRIVFSVPMDTTFSGINFVISWY